MRGFSRHRSFFTGLVTGWGALALAACSEPVDTADATSAPSGPASSPASATTSEPGNELSPESLEMAESGWLSVSVDGAVYSTFLDPDGRYRDVRDGAVVYTGTWVQNAARELCFTPNQGTSACWSHGAPGLDGVMQATNQAGRAIALKQITYQPPEPAADEQSPADEPDAQRQDPAASPDQGGEG
ncbi:MAG: hypothetical protein AAFQ90_03345 [Pseudomonadota bacterium]